MLTPYYLSSRLVRPCLTAALLLTLAGCARPSSEVVSRDYPYSPAFVASRPAALHIYPLNGSESQVGLPAALSVFIYSADGGALYGFEGMKPGLLKIELATARLSVVPGATDVGAAGLAVSKDEQRFILSGRYDFGSSRFCGLLELHPGATGRKALAQNHECRSQTDLLGAGLTTWEGLSLSPDGERLLVHNRSGLKIVNLADGNVEPLGDFMAGEWSPDGKWLAAVETAGQRRTILMDAKTLKEEKTLGNSTAHWSPDSRFILAVSSDLCGPYWFTLEVIDVASGERLSVDSSKCKVNVSTTGWVKARL